MSILVKDLDVALAFYTEKLGFIKMADIPLGDMRWVTVTSPDGIDGVELSFRPLAIPASSAYQKALFDAEIPAIALITDDIQADFARLSSRGVVFHGEPKDNGVIINAVFEDTCGNLVNLVQPVVK
jgi:catechol 2,3-dioxygenase-like lactoylglutathione lyase family enzyme